MLIRRKQSTVVVRRDGNTWGLDAGWDGYKFEWYSPEVEDNSLDRPPEKIQNEGFYSSGYQGDSNDWFVKDSQWMDGARTVNSGSTNKIGVSVGACLLCLLGIQVF